MANPDQEIEQAAHVLTDLIIKRNQTRAGKYAVIIKATVDDTAGNGVMSWDWYWNPDTHIDGDGH